MHISRRSRFWISALSALLMPGQLAAAGRGRATPDAAATQQAAVPEGTVRGFVRVDGDLLPLQRVYAFIAPGSPDGKLPVTLILATAMAIPADALARATTRRDLTRLLINGAIIELAPTGAASVFLRHGALGGQEIETTGDLTITENTATRVNGSIATAGAGDERKFGYALRFEISFDAPVIRTVVTFR